MWTVRMIRRLASVERGFHVSTKLKKGPPDGFVIRPMIPADKNQVRQLFHDYMREDRMARALGIKVPRDCERYVEQMILKAAGKNGCSVVAEETATGQIVGKSIWEIRTAEEENELMYFKNHSDSAKIYEYLRISEQICDDARARYNLQKVLHSIAGFVHGDYRAKGLLLSMEKEMFKAACELDIPLITFETFVPVGSWREKEFGVKTVKDVLIRDILDEGVHLNDDQFRDLRVYYHEVWVQDVLKRKSS